MTRIKVDYYCKKCNRRESGCETFHGYGTNGRTYNFKCCDNILHFKWNKS